VDFFKEKSLKKQRKRKRERNNVLPGKTYSYNNKKIILNA
jgi:hypothetical protein